MEVFTTIIDAFSGGIGPLLFLLYLSLGWFIIRPSGDMWSQFMSSIGWPIEIAQRIFKASTIPYLFVLPNLIIFTVYTLTPFFINIGLSLTEGATIQLMEREYSGLDNAERLLGEFNPDTGQKNLERGKFLKAVIDTIIFVILQVPIMVCFALCTALVLNRKIIGRGFWRAIFIYPVMLSPVAIGFIWHLILKRQGALSLTFIQWGILDDPIQWLQEPFWTMFWSIFVYTWSHLGFYMLILLSGLQAIPHYLYDLAKMDGTSSLRQLRKITLPLLYPSLLLVILLSFIKAFQAFEELYALNVGWKTIVTYIFETSGLHGVLTKYGLGIAATSSLIIAMALIILSLLQLWLSRKRSI